MKTTSIFILLHKAKNSSRYSANNTIYLPDNPQELIGKKKSEKGGVLVQIKKKEKKMDKRAKNIMSRLVVRWKDRQIRKEKKEISFIHSFSCCSSK